MKNTLLLTLILITAKLSFSQENNNKKIPPPLYVVISASGDTVKGRTVLIEPREYKKFNVLKGAEASNKYGNEGENGVVELKLKKGAKVLDLNALKKLYKIAQYKKVNITIDGEVSSSLVSTKKAIKEIKCQIIKQNEEININIVSNRLQVKTKTGEIVVRQ